MRKSCAAHNPRNTARQTESRRRMRFSVFDLFRRYQYDATVSPLRNRIAGTLVIADGLLNGISNRIDYAVLEQLVRHGRRFKLTLGSNLVAHTSCAARSTHRR